jgi:hypothetical protein
MVNTGVIAMSYNYHEERLVARVLIAIGGTQLAAVYDFQRERRLKSASQALRNLIAIGLKHAPEERRRIAELWPVIADEMRDE